ncbi:phosphate acetyltransferase [Maridesulfovibrio ferrireducens]|uniref:phosphate acetyltransferase n=1 Tax=Maridesulfovibrio ferrireducens TaxID=246191 RepID=UPI001A18FDD9|nr:phosphate acetyltransferase [Maridesulfovibrio ferrireducens]MBI9110601.1 phosphate acetyltransferase [Maridesulfovibrio ferrireducens]
MSINLYITATEEKSGKSAIALGVMQLLLRDIQNVAIFRPIINDNQTGSRDHDINLLMNYFNLDISYEDTYAYTLKEARELINNGKHSLLLENILNKYSKLEEKFDFVLCEGTDFQGKDQNFEFDINAEIAANLSCPVLLVANGRGKTTEDIIASTQLVIDALEDKGVDTVAAVINRITAPPSEMAEILSSIKCKTRCAQELLVYGIAEDESLGNPSMNDVRKWLDASVLYGHGRLDTLVDDYVIAAMRIGNFLEYIEAGSLIITPGDRSDIILSSLASRLSTSFPDISGILLTGGLQPSASVHRLIEGWTGVPIPILSVDTNTYRTTQVLSELYGRIDPEDQRKTASALGTFESHVNIDELRQRLVSTKSDKVTPKMFEYKLVQKAKANKQIIVLPEGTAERVLRAADMLTRRGVADIVLLGKADEVGSKISALGLDMHNVRILDPESSPQFESYCEIYFKLREHKGIRMSDARDRMLDPTYFGSMMVYTGDADGMVSGSVTTTAQTIRPAFEFIKTKPGASIVSSVFLMCLKDRVLVFGDCAVNPNPNAEQLAEIALSSAQTARIFGVEPRIALLSYSTGQSGKGADVEKVKEAVRIAKERAPDLLIEGPLQYDAAIDPSVAKTKLPDSQVAGRATVFIFPDLNTGNNTYKAVQRSAEQSVAIGPILQGLNKPVNDLSRGCTVPDIVNTVAITAIQAQAEKGLI